MSAGDTIYLVWEAGSFGRGAHLVSIHATAEGAERMRKEVERMRKEVETTRVFGEYKPFVSEGVLST